MKISRRETLQLSATALAGLSLAGLSSAAAQNAAAPAGLVDTQLRNAPPLPLNPDGSAVEYTSQQAGTIAGVLWKTKNRETPDIEFDVRKMKVKLDGRGTTKLGGTLTFDHLEKLPRHSQITLLQCGASMPRGIVKWTGVRFSDFAQSIGVQSIAAYGRFVGSDGYYLDEDIRTLMHPQVMLAWHINDEPIPPQNGAPLRLVVPFRYGARSVKAITEISLTATSFPPRPV